jgi:hypothetical protein
MASLVYRLAKCSAIKGQLLPYDLATVWPEQYTPALSWHHHFIISAIFLNN